MIDAMLVTIDTINKRINESGRCPDYVLCGRIAYEHLSLDYMSKTTKAFEAGYSIDENMKVFGVPVLFSKHLPDCHISVIFKGSEEFVYSSSRCQK